MKAVMTKKYADALKLCDIMLRFDSENELGRGPVYVIYFKLQYEVQLSYPDLRGLSVIEFLSLW